MQVVKRLLRPAAKVPSNNWESFMANLSDGDAKGCWYVVSRKVALYTAPVVALALVVHQTTGMRIEAPLLFLHADCLWHCMHHSGKVADERRSH